MQASESLPAGGAGPALARGIHRGCPLRQHAALRQHRRRAARSAARQQTAAVSAASRRMHVFPLARCFASAAAAPQQASHTVKSPTVRPCSHRGCPLSGGAAGVPATTAHAQAVATDGPLVMPEKKHVIMPKYCESVYQSIRRPTRTIHVRLPAEGPTGPPSYAQHALLGTTAAANARACGGPRRSGRCRSAASTRCACRR